MTEQDAIRLLRTEQPGDSEYMELAKQMGARALECAHLRFVLPVCGECGHFITGIEIDSIPDLSYKNTMCTRHFYPARCPKCKTVFVQCDISHEEQTCILRGSKEDQNDAT